MEKLAAAGCTLLQYRNKSGNARARARVAELQGAALTRVA